SLLGVPAAPAGRAAAGLLRLELPTAVALIDVVDGLRRAVGLRLTLPAAVAPALVCAGLRRAAGGRGAAALRLMLPAPPAPGPAPGRGGGGGGGWCRRPGAGAATRRSFRRGCCRAARRRESDRCGGRRKSAGFRGSASGRCGCARTARRCHWHGRAARNCRYAA